MTGCVAAGTQPPLMNGGMNILLPSEPDFDELHEAFTLTQELGATIAVLNLQWCLDDVESEVYECERTPDEETLAEAVVLAHELGLEVRLRVLINESSVGWRGAIPPRTQWMDTYRELMLRTARFCQIHEVDGLYLLSELHDTMWLSTDWVGALIWDVRGEYSGLLAITDFIWTDHVFPNNWFLDAQHPFGAGVNLVGASYYPEIDDCEGDLAEEMASFMVRVRDYHELFLFQIDEISEFGTVPACNANSSSWSDWDQADEAFQADFYEAILGSIAELGVENALCWGLELGHPDREFGPFAPGQDAQDVLAAAWGAL